MKKILKFMATIVTCLVVMFTATSCKKDDETANNGGGCPAMTLEDLNAMLNDNETMNMRKANAVAVVPFDHVNGPKDEWDFYALINFVYRDRAAGYVKYQVTYLSCTCRSIDVNYWQTAYIELTIPGSRKANDAQLKALSFDEDSSGAYTAGFWGDSNPIYDEATHTIVHATYDKMEVGEEATIRRPTSDVSEDPNYYLNEEDGTFYYPSIKEDFIPKLIGMTKAELDRYNFAEDLLSEDVLTKREYDQFTGASVSTNNILRILHAVFKYHADTYFTK